MSEIKLFVCCHKDCQLPKHELLVPIQVGAALTDIRFPGFIYDNSGDNISELNRSYCELTAQYWAWKNCGADYLGFFHYRRFLYPDFKATRPYRIDNFSDEKILERLGFDRFPELIKRYSMIAPLGENMHVSVREHYLASPFQYGADLNRIEGILSEQDPAYRDAMEQYLNGTVHYFGNIFIMERATFHQYCAWLFPALEEFDRQTDTREYSDQAKRVDGYLAERLFGVFYTYHRYSLPSLELPRVFYEPDPFMRCAKQCEIMLLPPGSKRRSTVKSIVRRVNEKQ